MFQQWFVEFISVISDMFVGISALTVAVLGIVGLYQWKRELTGKIKIDVARAMAKKALQFRDEAKSTRSPFTFSGESAERERDENESLDKTHLLDEFYARRNRLILLQETLRELYELSWEAEILIDGKIANHLVPLEKIFRELFASTEAYFQTNLERVDRAKPADPEEWIMEHYQRIYGTSDDDFSKSIDAAVNNLNEELKAIIKI